MTADMIIITALVLAVCAVGVFFARRRKRSGGCGCSGCSSCARCGGDGRKR